MKMWRHTIHRKLPTMYNASVVRGLTQFCKSNTQRQALITQRRWCQPKRNAGLMLHAESTSMASERTASAEPERGCRRPPPAPRMPMVDLRSTAPPPHQLGCSCWALSPPRPLWPDRVVGPPPGAPRMLTLHHCWAGPKHRHARVGKSSGTPTRGQMSFCSTPVLEFGTHPARACSPVHFKPARATSARGGDSAPLASPDRTPTRSPLHEL